MCFICGNAREKFQTAASFKAHVGDIEDKSLRDHCIFDYALLCFRIWEMEDDEAMIFPSFVSK